MNTRLKTLLYVMADWFSAAITWCFFFSFRKIYLEYSVQKIDDIAFDHKFYTGLFIIPLSWLFFYAITGTYYNIYRKSRLKEMGQTLLQTAIGVVVIFFALLIDDQLAHYQNYYIAVVVLFIAHFFSTFFFRFLLSSHTAYKIHNRIIGFNTLLLGSNEKAHELFIELENQKNSSGFKFVGYLHINGNDGHIMKPYLPHMGHVNQLSQMLIEYNINEVIIAAESSEHNKLGKVLNALKGKNVNVNIIPDMYDILSGSVKMTSIFGTPLIQINQEIMPAWQKSVKRILDISVSVVAVVLLLPIYLISSILVRFSSKGSILYSHERIGVHGKSFTMYKFRSMYIDAEKDGPQLSSKKDPRITPFGRFMRKTRIDETPQFFNVIKGDMSLVGPRPERQYFIDQIIERSSHYAHLQRIKPGITSWGQVKYGYAENVNQMIERMKYDILYLENMSLFVDFKILIYTILIVLQGRGK